VNEHHNPFWNSKSESFRKLNPQLFNPTATGGDHDLREVCPAEPQPDVQHEPVGQVQGAPGRTTRFRLSVVIRRRQLVDPENVFTKSIAGDCLRYAGVLPEDDPRTIASFEVKQEEVATAEEEGTLIHLAPMADDEPSHTMVARQNL
jgi:hypothetical protein